MTWLWWCPVAAKRWCLCTLGDPESRESSEKLLKDESFKRFEKYTLATYGKIGSKGICMQCSKYEVEATLTGRFDVAPDTVPERQWKDKLGLFQALFTSHLRRKNKYDFGPLTDGEGPSIVFP